MADVQIFEHSQFGKIRVVVINGITYFVGKDVAVALGYKNTKDALIKHVDEEDKLGSQIATSGQRRKVTLINESGLYSLILSSKLPDAKKFKRWVTSEVLPAIIRTGEYVDPNRKSKHWLETRQLGKKTRKQETDIIKEFIDIKEPDIYPEDHIPESERCPKCHCGRVFVAKRGKAVNGNPYSVLVCANEKYGCDYRETAFVNLNSKRRHNRNRDV